MTEGLFSSGTGGGSFPKFEELEGKLVLMKPSKIEVVPKSVKIGGKAGDTQERVTADVWVLDDDSGEWDEYQDMYLSQASIVGASKKALKPGNPPYILGRAGKVPSKIGKDQGFDSREKIEAGLEAWLKRGGKGDKPNFAWGLDAVEPEDAAKAQSYLASKTFAPAE